MNWAGGASARRPTEREAAQVGFERELLGCCRDPAPGAHPYRTLCQRVEHYHPARFTFVAVPEAGPTALPSGAHRSPPSCDRRRSPGWPGRRWLLQLYLTHEQITPPYESATACPARTHACSQASRPTSASAAATPSALSGPPAR